MARATSRSRDRVLVEAGGQDGHATRRRRHRRRRDGWPRERIGHVLEHQAEGRRLAAAPQVGGGQVGPVVELSRGRFHPFGRARPETPASSLTTRDTVLMLTPASAATSRIVARLRRAVAARPGAGPDNVVSPIRPSPATIGHDRAGTILDIAMHRRTTVPDNVVRRQREGLPPRQSEDEEARSNDDPCSRPLHAADRDRRDRSADRRRALSAAVVPPIVGPATRPPSSTAPASISSSSSRRTSTRSGSG